MNLEDEIGIEIELDQKVETIDDLDKFNLRDAGDRIPCVSGWYGLDR